MIIIRTNSLLLMLFVLFLTSACQQLPGNQANQPQPVSPNHAPIALFNLSTREGFAPLRVNFDASASRDKDGQIVNFDWDLGDGAISRDEKFFYAYSNPGTYEVQLTATDDKGAQSVGRVTYTTNQTTLKIYLEIGQERIELHSFLL